MHDKPVRAALDMSLVTGYPEHSRMIIEGDRLVQDLSVNNRGTPLRLVITAAPGQTVLRFTSDAPRVVAPLDPRDLVFGVANFTMQTLTD